MVGDGDVLPKLNGTSLVRCHHLLKTFWTGDRGWTDRQLPCGTVIWKSLTGKTYKTRPGSRIFFPTWNTTTAELPTTIGAGGAGRQPQRHDAPTTTHPR